MNMYKGKLPCIGCGKSGEEAHRQSKDCLCEDCENSLKIGRAIVKERNLTGMGKSQRRNGREQRTPRAHQASRSRQKIKLLKKKRNDTRFTI